MFSLPKIAIKDPTGTLISFSITFFNNIPSSGLSNSLTTFSVSISTNVSPLFTLSPSFLSHEVTDPSFIAKPHFGITIGIIESANLI